MTIIVCTFIYTYTYTHIAYTHIDILRIVQSRVPLSTTDGASSTAFTRHVVAAIVRAL